MIAAHHQLSIIDQIQREEQSAQRGIDQHGNVVIEKYCQDAKDHKDDQGDKQHATPGGKIELSLQRKQGQGNANDNGQAHSYKDL